MLFLLRNIKEIEEIIAVYLYVPNDFQRCLIRLFRELKRICTPHPIVKERGPIRG